MGGGDASFVVGVSRYQGIVGLEQFNGDCKLQPLCSFCIPLAHLRLCLPRLVAQPCDSLS